MGNLVQSVKRLFSNKNTVTVVGVVLAFVVLYVGYNMRIQSELSPITVPYAKVQISPGIQITSDMIGTRQVTESMLTGKVIRTQAEIVDKFSSSDTVIPEGSLFYDRQVVEKEQLPGNIILDYPKGYVLYNMSVTTETTYGNSVFPGNYIDIYLKAVNKLTDGETMTADADKIMLGKLMANVEVLAVKDSSGKAVFANLDEQRTPAMVVFAVPEEYYILLKKAEYLRTYDSTLIPVPTNESLKDEPGDLEISSEQLKDWINKVTVWTET